MYGKPLDPMTRVRLDVSFNQAMEGDLGDIVAGIWIRGRKRDRWMSCYRLHLEYGLRLFHTLA